MYRKIVLKKIYIFFFHTYYCLFYLLGIAEHRIVCYYTNWSVYRPGTAKFSPQNINPYLCTHLIYAFGGFTKENALRPFDKYQDIEKGIIKIWYLLQDSLNFITNLSRSAELAIIIQHCSVIINVIILY